MSQYFATGIVFLYSVLSLANSNPMRECQKRIQQLDTALIQEIEKLNVPEIQKFLVEAYKKTGQELDISNVIYKKTSSFPLGLSFDFEVNDVTSKGQFRGSLANGFYSDTRIKDATDNTEWDDLGNVIAPPTEITCTVVRNFQEYLRISNATTNKQIGSIKASHNDSTAYPATVMLVRIFSLQ